MRGAGVRRHGHRGHALVWLAIVDDQGQPPWTGRRRPTRYAVHRAVHQVQGRAAERTNDSFQQIMTGFTPAQTACCGTTPAPDRRGYGARRRLGQVRHAARPAGPVATSPTSAYSYNGMSDPKNADADWAWLTLGTARPQITFLESTGYFPSSTKVVDDARIQKNPLLRRGHRDAQSSRPGTGVSPARPTGARRSSCQFPARAAGRDQPEEAVDV